MAERMCQYGDCTNTDTPHAVSHRNGESRVRFCCEEHAALWLLRRAWGYRGNAVYSSIEPAILTEGEMIRQ